MTQHETLALLFVYLAVCVYWQRLGWNMEVQHAYHRQ